MAIFYFTTRTRDEEFNDFIEAETLETAKLALEDRKIRFKDLHQAGILEFEIDLTPILGLNQTDLLHMTKFFAALLRAGVPIIRTLELVKFNTANTAIKRALNTVLWNIQKGYTVTEAIKREDRIFPPWYYNLVAIGEGSGELVQALERICELLARQIELKRKIIKAIAYPLFTLCVSMGLVVYLLVFIVPKFKEIYGRFGKALPLPTQVLISTSDIFLHNYKTLIIVGICIVIFIMFFRNTKTGQAIWNAVQMDIPLIGPVFLTYNTALFSKNLSTLLSSGVHIMSALESVAEVMENRNFKENIHTARDTIEEGKGFAFGLKRKDPIVPTLALNMIEIGEEAGSLPEMLNNVAEFYNIEVEEKIGTLTGSIEPILLIFLGVIIGGIVISLYLPIFGLAKVLSGGH
ncbi:type II secretion system F family protein [Candidatus Riflebacteria bacterium]